MILNEYILLFTGLGFMSLAIYLFVSSFLSSSSQGEALAWASGDEPKESKSPFINFSRPLVHNFTIHHVRKIKNKNYRESVEKKLLTAGVSSELNVDEFIGLQILWGIMFPIVFSVMNFALQLDFSYNLAIGISAIGAYFPHFYCSQQKSERYTSVIIDLPFLVDLLALSTEAGLDFINAIQRIVDKAKDSVLTDELYIVLKDIKLGSSRTEALKGLASRLDIPEITSFVAVIVDADQTGASISSVLKDQSNQMRLERFVRAEKAGAKAAQAILIPMMLFIVPAVMLMIFAPVIIQFFTGGN
jgi:tight adherence protein C